MKVVLALATLALVALVLEEKARQVAGEAHEVYGEAVNQARGATEALTHKVERNPLVSLLTAGIFGYAAAALMPRRR